MDSTAYEPDPLSAKYTCLATHRLASDALVATGSWSRNGEPYCTAAARAHMMREAMPGYARRNGANVFSLAAENWAAPHG